MRKRVIIYLLVCAFVLPVFTACEQPIASNSGDVVDGNNSGDPGSGDTGTKYSVSDALTENSASHEDAEDYVWDNSSVVQITLNGNSITAPSSGATVNGSICTITSAGTYKINGSLTDGQIIVNTTDEGTVRLILNGVNITHSQSSPIYVASAKKVVIVLSDNTQNYVADGKSYVFENADTDEPNAAVFSKSDLTIYGSGSLNITGNYNDGIASKDGLIIASGNISVTSVDDGIRGKDYLIVEDGNIIVNAKGDGLKSDNEEDVSKGYILIENGVLNVTSGKDAVTAETDALVVDGDLTVTSGGGSNSRIDANTSAKAMKGLVSTIIDGGTFTISSADDAIHTNKDLVINGGTFSISSGDDGIHADSTLTINGSNINISKSYEGIESRAVITINDGNIHIISSDDGLNVAGGNDGSGWPGGPGSPGGMTSSGNLYLYINGGYVYVEAAGDGIDVNGSIVMTGGNIIVNGPTANNNGAIDYDASFKITGGFIVGAGSSGMAQIPGTSSTQYSVLINFSSRQQAGSLVHIQTSDGSNILSFVPTKYYQSIAFSSPDLQKGSTYDVYLGGSSTGTVKDGWYQNGTYTAGTKYTSFTLSSVATKVTK